MNTKFRIKNFRVFDEEGALFNIAPITLITGANSAGKSSFAKACLLLESFLKQINRNIEKCKLDFMTYPLNTLGQYDKTIHKGSKSKKITFSYSIYSDYLFDDIEVTLVFNRDEYDELNNGLLESLSMSVKNSIIYAWHRNGDSDGNFFRINTLKKTFSTFLMYEHELQNMASLVEEIREDEIEGGESDFSEEIEQCNRFLQSSNKIFLFSVANHISRQDHDGVYFGKKLNIDDINWFEKHNTFFRFSLYSELENLNTDEIEDFLINLTDKLNFVIREEVSEKPKFIQAIKKIVDGYKKSTEDSFVNYIEFLERIFFESDEPNGYHLDIKPFNLTFNSMANRPLVLSQKYFTFGGPSQPYIFSKNKGTTDKEVDFLMAYEVISILDYAYNKDSNYYSWEYDPDFQYIPVHEIYNAFKHYFVYLLNDCLNVNWHLTYVGSSRVEVKKLYSLDTDDSFTKLLLEFLNLQKEAKKRKNSPKIINMYNADNPYNIHTFTNKWLNAFGIGKELILKIDEDGLGVRLYILKQANEEPVLLAYEGYGITQLVSLLFYIEVSILKAKGKYKNILDLPDYNKFVYEDRTIIIEEPEIHLHPRYQSLLAEMFYEAYKEYGINFIIETHSEYLIRKTQTLVSKMGFETNEECDKKCPFQTIYVSSDKAPYALGYRKDGKFKENFGPGFFDEATNLMMEIF